MQVQERVLPHSLDAEKAILGALLVAPRRWSSVSGDISARDFFRDAHRRIFECIGRLVASGSAVDAVTIGEDLRRLGELDECGGLAYIIGMTDSMPASAHIDDYVRIVRDRARLRAVIFTANKALADAYDAEEAADRIAERTVRDLFAIEAAQATRPITAQDAVEAYMRAMNTGGLLDPLPTGYADLDALIGGVQPEDLTIVAARPSVGKSAFSLGLGRHMASFGHKTAVFSLEMRQHALAAQLLAWQSGVSASTLSRGQADPLEFAAVSEAWTQISGDASPLKDLYVLASASTLTQLSAWCRRLKDERGLTCVVVDYLQLLVGQLANGASTRDAVAAISIGLKRLASDLKVAMVALSQLSRAPEARTDKRPHLSDLRDSGALEQDCDLALLLFRPEMHKRTDENDGLAECIVAKNRTGPVGVVRLFFDKRLARFSDLANHA